MNNNFKHRAGDNRDADRQRSREHGEGRDYDRDRRVSNHSHSSQSYPPSGGNNSGGRGGGNGRGFGSTNGSFGGRGGRGGGVKHMGEHPSIIALLNKSELGDQACLKVLNPQYSERERSHFLEGAMRMPPLANWRYADPVGLQLDRADAALTVRSNFFKAPLSNIPKILFHYNVSIFKYKFENGVATVGTDPEDIALKKDSILNSVNVNKLIHKHVEWQEAGLAYDGGSTLYATQKLPFLCGGAVGLPSPVDPLTQEDLAGRFSIDYPLNHRFQDDVFADHNPERIEFNVVLNYTGEIVPPVDEWTGAAPVSVVSQRASREALRALDVALLSFARRELASGNWFLLGNRVFSNDPKRKQSFELSPAFVGMMGYHASFRACLSGLALVKDISVTCFLRGGNLLQFVCNYLRCSEKELAQVLHPNNHSRDAESLTNLLRNCKLKMVHIKMSKKFRSFGAPADSPESAFNAGEEDVPSVTVAQYFQDRYNRTLRAPRAPTVNVGSSSRAILLPMELLEILPGQTRQRSITGDISAKIIKEAAMRPNERFKQLTSQSYLFPELQNDYEARAFGIDTFTTNTASGAAKDVPLPMRVKGTILPPAKLLYGRNRVKEPKLEGSWNLAGGFEFAHKAPFPEINRASAKVYPFGAMFVHGGLGRVSELDALATVKRLVHNIQNESVKLGIPMELMGACKVADYRNPRLEEDLLVFKKQGARIVVVVLLDENIYSRVKYLADSLCLPTQCARYSIVTKAPRNYEVSLLVKMNMKMGGVNHTLASRESPQPADDPYVFQRPPNSISWLFDEHTMVIGIDVNHSEKRADGPSEQSVVAVVASMDGMLGQYCAHISSCNANHEPVNTLHESFHALLKAFCARNAGQFPRNIIVYRDGVADSQFNSTLDSECTALKSAVEDFDLTEDFGKITFIVCQKRHHTRFFFQGNSTDEYLNPCVGLCVDVKGFGPDAINPASEVRGHSGDSDPISCIMGEHLNEFYLNSHAAVLGTSKPTKYILLHDEIGLKMSELQLLTFWLTHLYGRCTRSVSIVAPAYYAHWAAKRGRVLLAGGLGDPAGLKHMSAEWMVNKDTPAMFFI